MVVDKKLKTSVYIEKLLQWAYLDELPKRQISSAEGVWEGIREYGQRGGIDIGAGGAQRYPHFGAPDTDAEIIEKAVGALGQASIEDNYDLIVGELWALVTVNDFRSRKALRSAGKATEAGLYDKDAMPPAFAPRDVLIFKSINVAALVTTHAVMRTRPHWSSVDPKPFPVPASHGRGNKIVGECRGKNQYTTGAYCPLRWSPSPIEVVLGRADYHVWHEALVKLSRTLELTEHEPLPPAASATPWLAPEPSRRVFSYAMPRERPLPLKPSRPPAGSPRKRSKVAKRRKLQNQLAHVPE
jgi:hypothetical protein